MQQFPHRQSTSNTPLLIVAAGLGALLAYALSSPQRRAAMAAAGHTALDAGSRLASSSTERLREWMPERLQDSLDRVTTRAGDAADEVSQSAADRLHHAADLAAGAMRRAAARARGLTARARHHADEAWDRAPDPIDLANDAARHPSVLGPIVAAAALGASLYAMRRPSGNERTSELDSGGANGTVGDARPLGAAPADTAP